MYHQPMLLVVVLFFLLCLCCLFDNALSLLLLSVSPSAQFTAEAGGEPWECPSSWPSHCWIMNPTTNAEYITPSCTYAGRSDFTHDCWSCPSCSTDGYPGANFGFYFQVVQCNEPTGCQAWCEVPKANAVAFTTTASSCSQFEFECAEGFRPEDPSFSSSSSACIECSPHMLNFFCPLGYFPKRCPLSTDTTKLEDLCNPCSNPRLPAPATIDNSPMYTYGEGKLYEDCKVLVDAANGPVDNTICASFQTPKWETGWCTIECAPGYVQTLAAATNVIGATPTCERCQTTCDAGFLVPDCPGGSYPPNNGKCLPCPLSLPVFAQWTQGCDWRPAQGYYLHDDAATNTIRPCNVSACAASSSSSRPFLLGCHDNNPGQCSGCGGKTCGPGSFIIALPYLDQCQCQTCNTAVQGVSYYVRNCSTTKDSVVAPCTTPPPLLTMNILQYISKACTLWTDTQIKDCQQPSSRPGMLLTRACTNITDAEYQPCPGGFACNGSSTPFLCDNSTSQALNGLCVCLNATHLVGLVCRPISCPSGYYPDPSFGSVCQPCTDPAESVAAMTIPDVLGLQACVCPSGYFMRPSAAHDSSSSGSRIHCWPCGDLGCDAFVERQTECPGDRVDEPQCICALGPGMQPQASDCGNVACATGYTAGTTTSVVAGLYDDYLFLPIIPSSFSSNANNNNNNNRNNISSLVIVNIEGTLILQLLENDGGLLLYKTSDQTTFSIPLTNIFQVGGWRTSNVKIRSILGYSSGLVWVLLTYTGLCFGSVVAEDQDQDNCWAIDLIRVQPTQTVPTTNNCVVSMMLCIILTSELHVDFEPRTMYTTVNDFALGQGGTSLLLVFDNSLVYRYPIQPASTPASTSATASFLIFSSSSSPSQLRVRSIAEALHGLYVVSDQGQLLFLSGEEALHMMQHGGGGNNNNSMLTIIRRFSVSFDAPASHILLAETEAHAWVQIDLWNYYVSSPFLLAPSALSFHHNRLVYSNNNGSILFIQQAATTTVCPIDTVLYKGETECQAMQCLRTEPCGPYSLRDPGSSTCICQPGYYMSAGVCLPCPMPSYHCTASQQVQSAGVVCPSYCTGRGPPQLCPPYSVTYGGGFAAQIQDCQCIPQTYLFDDICLPCPIGFWCPFNSTSLPVACSGGGRTSTEGAASPLECICPQRTHGLTCQPCNDLQDCSLKEPDAVNILDISIRWWAPMGGEDMLRLCLSPHEYIVYSVFGMAPDMQTEGNTHVGGVLATPDLLQWYWFVVLRPASPFLLTTDILFNVSTCLTKSSPSGLDLRLQGSKSIFISMVTPYESRYEWNGDADQPSQTCIAGYEELTLLMFGSLPHCFPCLNGTVRSRRDTNKRCTPCSTVASFSHAPFLGMSECVCMPGYSRASGPDEPLLCESSQMLLLSAVDAPWWYPAIFASPLITASVVTLLGIFIIFMSVLTVHNCF